jgi:hypothetical protein
MDDTSSYSAIGSNLELGGIASNWEPGKGLRSVLTYSGTENAVKGLANLLRTSRPDLKWSFDNSEAPLWKIELSQPESIDGQTNIDPPAVWELIGQDEVNDVLDHPTSRALKVSSETLYDQAIAAIKDLDSGRSVDVYPSGATADGKTANALIDLAGQGHKTYARGQYVLRKTQIINSRSTIKAAFDRIDYVWSTTGIQDAEPTIPDATLFSIAEIPSQSDVIPILGNPLTYRWGWLKKTPSVIQTSGYRFQITQEWWLSRWNNYTYVFTV